MSLSETKRSSCALSRLFGVELRKIQRAFEKLKAAMGGRGCNCEKTHYMLDQTWDKVEEALTRHSVKTKAQSLLDRARSKLASFV